MDGIDAGVTGAKRAQLRKLLQEFGGIHQSISMIWDRRGSRNIGLILERIPQFGSR